MLSFRSIADLLLRGTYLGVNTTVLVEGIGFYKVTNSGLTADNQDIIDLGGIKRAEAVLLTGSTFSSCGISVNQTHALSETQAVKIAPGGFAAMNAGETPEAIVLKVIDTDNYIVGFCGALPASFTATWSGLADGTYYHTDSGISLTPDTPVRPVFVKRDDMIIVNPMVGFNTSMNNLFNTDFATSGVNPFNQGDTLELTSEEVKYPFTHPVWGSITNSKQSLDLLMGAAKGSVNRSATGSTSWQASDNGATVWMVGNGNYTPPVSPDNGDSVSVICTGASGVFEANGNNINNAAGDFSLTQNELHFFTFTTGRGWAAK